jgi:hypothetical protein
MRTWKNGLISTGFLQKQSKFNSPNHQTMNSATISQILKLIERAEIEEQNALKNIRKILIDANG